MHQRQATSDTPVAGADESRPPGRPVVAMSWHDLLFIHWRVEPSALNRLLGPGLEPDIFDGSAWIGLVPFTMPRVRPLGIRIPWAHRFHECNVRTYVTVGGVPGVWFLSLDAASFLAAHAARLWYRLPYHHADITMATEDDRVCYQVRRRADSAATTLLQWSIGSSLGPARPGSLAWFLTERYCLYVRDRRQRLLRGPIHHPRWQLKRARLLKVEDRLLPAAGIAVDYPPESIMAAEPLAAQAWRLQACKDRAPITR